MDCYTAMHLKIRKLKQISEILYIKCPHYPKCFPVLTTVLMMFCSLLQISKAMIKSACGSSWTESWHAHDVHFSTKLTCVSWSQEYLEVLLIVRNMKMGVILFITHVFKLFLKLTLLISAALTEYDPQPGFTFNL